MKKSVWAVLALAALAAGPAAPALAEAVRATVGPYRVEMSTDPAVIPVGKATLVLTLTDAGGKPVPGADVRALTGMPGMFMGEREQTALPQPDRPGVYAIPAQFPMAGGYETKITISGPAGTASGVLAAKTGQNTAPAAGGPRVTALLFWLAGAALAAFVLWRVRRTGQRVRWGAILNRQVAGGLLLLGVMLTISVYAVQRWRRPGAMTPIEAQAMEMNTPAPPGVTPVTLARVRRGPVADIVRYSGQAVPQIEVDVFPRVTGVLTWMPFYTGDRVRRGQLLARLDTSRIEPQVAERRAGVTMAERQVAVARAEQAQMREEVEQAHAERAGKQGALDEARASLAAAREERESAVANLAAAQTRVADAEAQVRSAKADQDYWRTQIERSAALREEGAISGEEFGRDRAQAENAEAKVQQAQSGVSEAKAQVRAAQSARRKADALIRSAQAKIEQAHSDLNAHDAHVRSARAAARTAGERIAQAEAGVAQARSAAAAASTERGYSTIRSSLDGVITQRLLSPGVLVNPGQAILKVAQIRPIRLQVNVADVDRARIRVGSPVLVRGRNGSERPVTARVTSIAPALDPQARTGVVEAVVPNERERFLPGEYVVMEITASRRNDTLLVPARALQSMGAETFVWVAEPVSGDQLTARRVAVRTGVGDGANIAILSGLTEGQRVIVAGNEYPRNGDAVAEATPVTPLTPVPSPATGRGGPITPPATASRQAGDAAVSGPPLPAAGEGTGVRGGEGPGARVAPEVRIAVTDRGYEPAEVTLRAGVPARITFVRTTEATCGAEIVFPDHGIRKALPLNQPVTVALMPKKSGAIRFTCGMDMFRGKAVVR